MLSLFSKNPRLFDAIARGNYTISSDIDIFLTRGPKYNTKSALKLYSNMINTINFPVDIVIEDALPK